MSENIHKIHEQEMITPARALMGVFLGVGSIAGMWFLSSLLYVILK
jgi:hypothetical protein